MINSITMQTDLPNIEEMVVWGEWEPNADLSCTVIRAELTPANQLIYDNAVILFLPDQYTEVTNTVANLSISRITSTPITVETENVDFDLLSEVDKDKLRALLALFIELNNLQN